MQKNVTSLQEAEEEQTHLIKELQETSKVKDEFLATISHELRTPLNAIMGFSEAITIGLAGDVSSTVNRMTERTHENSRRLLNLIDDLLDISKMEAGRLDLVNQPFRPAKLLTDVQSTMGPQAAQKGIKFLTHLDENMPDTLMGDTHRLGQIILNLTSNAIKFTEYGKITLSFMRHTPTEWTIEVSDTGIGIAPHPQEIIFDKFRQADSSSSRVFGGSGLGLAIVRQLAETMEGNVTVESRINVGSTFTVRLPLLESEKVAV